MCKDPNLVSHTCNTVLEEQWPGGLLSVQAICRGQIGEHVQLEILSQNIKGRVIEEDTGYQLRLPYTHTRTCTFTHKPEHTHTYKDLKCSINPSSMFPSPTILFIADKKGCLQRSHRAALPYIPPQTSPVFSLLSSGSEALFGQLQQNSGVTPGCR